MAILNVVDNLIWTWDEPFRRAGIEFGARMTIVRLPNGDLWIHSPLEPGDEMRRAIDEIGPVRHVIAPNKMHYLGTKAFHEAYPEAQLYGAPGLAEAHSDIPFNTTLGEMPEAAWDDVLEQVVFHGNLLNEVVFLHREARTLIVTDLCFYLKDGQGNAATQLFAKAAGVHDRPGPTPIFKLATRDHNQARHALDCILRWDFDRIILSHGAIYESNGKAALREKFAWLLS
jgi:hypothetical protein